MPKKVTIVGAGPAGSYSAYLLSKAGFNVEIYEEHKEIGIPVHCTGIVTEDIFSYIRFDKNIFLNRLDKVKVISKNNSAEIRIRDYVINRSEFDQYFARLAKKRGCRIFTGFRLVNHNNKCLIIKDLRNNSIKKIKKEDNDILIGADGPFSIVNRLFFRNNFDFYKGIQIRAKIKTDKNTYKTFFGDDFPKFFGWIVPENEDIARIGLAAKNNANFYFENFIKKLNIKKNNIINKQAGLIPIHTPKAKIQKNNMYLVGDAASQIKSTTGGGIIPSLKAAEILADSIINNKNYDKELKNLKKELLLHLKVRLILDKFSDNDYDKLIDIIDNRQIKKILGNLNRDNLIKLLPQLILKEPRLLFYLRHIL